MDNSGAIKIAGAYATVELDLANLKKEIKTAQNEFKHLRASVEKGTKETNSLQSQLEQVSNLLEMVGGKGFGTFTQLTGAIGGGTSALAGMGAAGIGLTAALGAIAGVIAGIVTAIKTLTATAKFIWEVSTEFESLKGSMASTGVVAKKMGYDVQAVYDNIQNLELTTEFSAEAIADFTQTMVRAGVSLEDQNELVTLFQDNLKALPNLVHGYDGSLQQLGDSFTTEMSAQLNTIGLADKTWEQLKATGEASLKAQGKAVTDTTAKIEGLKLALKDTQGVGEVMGDTIASQLNRASKDFKRAKQELGSAFQPVMVQVLKLVTPLIKQFSLFIASIDWEKIALGVKNFIFFLVQLGKIMFQILQLFPGVNMQIKTMQMLFSTIKKPKGEIKKFFQDLAKQIESTPLDKLEQLNTKTQEAQKTIQDLQKQLADEAYNFNKSLAQIADRHLERLNKTKNALEEETKAFEESQSEMLQKYLQTLSDMEQEYAKKIAELNADKDKEVREFNKAEKKKRKDFEETQEEIRKANSKKLQDLKRLLQQELSRGGSYNETVVAQLEKAIKEQENILNAKLDEDRARFEEEMAELKKENDLKLAEIDRKIAQEKARYEKEIAEKKARYEQDKQNEINAYLKKKQELTKIIAEEEAFLSKHSETIKTINREALLDEIEELKKNYAERTAEINKQIEEQKNIITSANGAIAANTSMVTDTIAKDWEETFEKMDESYEEFKNSFDLVTWFAQKWNEIKLIWVSIGYWIDQNILKPIRDKILKMWEDIKNSIQGRWNDFTGNGGVLVNSFKKIIREAIEGIEKALKQISIYLPGLGSLTPFRYLYLPKPYKRGGVFPGGLMGIMNERGLDEAIYLPDGSKIFSYEKTKSIVDSLKRSFNNIPDLLSNYKSSSGIDMSKLIIGGNNGFRQENTFIVKSEIDIKKVSRDLEFEWRTKGLNK